MAVFDILQGNHPPRPTHPAFAEKLWTFMQRCWDGDPNSRPEVPEALQILLATLVSHLDSHPTHERISWIESIFSDYDQVTVEDLCGDNPQNFINVIYEVSAERFRCWGTNRFTPVQPSTSCRLGIGQRQTMDPQEVPEFFIRYLWPPSPTSEIVGNPALLRSNSGPTV